MAGLVYGSVSELPEGMRLQATAKLLEARKKRKPEPVRSLRPKAAGGI